MPIPQVLEESRHDAPTTVENGTARIAIYGLLDITRDKQGLVYALALKEIVDQAVQRLRAEKELQEAVAASVAAKKVSNPFA